MHEKHCGISIVVLRLTYLLLLLHEVALHLLTSDGHLIPINSYIYCFPVSLRVFLCYAESGTSCFLTAHYVTNAVVMMVVVVMVGLMIL